MAEIHFGTDGWRAIIGEDFTNDNLVRVIDAAARVFKEDAVAAGRPADAPGTLIVGHDCRQDAHAYAQLAAEVAAAQSFRVLLTQDYCPTPTLCWSVAQDADAVGGIMLTSSHNPAEYLGVKLRMNDGGAAGKEFTDRVEAAFADAPADARGAFETVDLMTPYLATLKERVDVEAIRNANLRVVVDPLYGAGRIYLAQLLRDLGVEVCEINNAEDPTFDGLHPEPIPPWVDRCIAKVPELGYDAGFINDGDADRIGAVDERGNFVNPHRIITLLTSHLAEDKGLTGRVVSTITASAMLARQCKRFGPGADQHAGGLQVDLRRDGEGRRHAGRRGVRRHRHPQPRHGARRLADGAAPVRDDGAARHEPGSVGGRYVPEGGQAGVRAPRPEDH